MVSKFYSRLKYIFNLLLSLIIIFALAPTNIVKASNDIESINITAEIQDDGSVIISDHRIFNAYSGTEHYISIGNLGDSELQDFEVYDSNNVLLEDIGKWDVNASFDEKAGKYGINHSGNNLELCFGLGEYGRREFTIRYKITNFVRNLNDNHQAIYWKFLNEDMNKIYNAEVKIINNKGFTYQYPETRIWGFGFEGRTEILENELTAEIGNNFTSTNYMVVLAIFEGKVFDTNATFDYTSEALIKKAKEGSYSYDSDSDSSNEYPKNNRLINHNTRYRSNGFFGFFLGPTFSIFAFILMIIGVKIFSKSSPKKLSMPLDSDVDYYREIPYDNFLETEYITDSSVSDIISAYIIKWINDQKLNDDVEEKGFIFKKNQLSLRILTQKNSSKDVLEQQLWEMVIKASKGDGVLTQKEFNKYISGNISKFNIWVSNFSEESKRQLYYKGYLKKEEVKILGIPIRDKYELAEEGNKLQNNIVGFKKYLKDFSLLNERGISESLLWEEYMVWAAYLGVAKEVYEQFKIVNPNIEHTMGYNLDTIYYTNVFGRSVQSTYRSANSSSSSSFGGGGSSFGGGGGGSFGGGSGGGTR